MTLSRMMGFGLFGADIVNDDNGAPDWEPILQWFSGVVREQVIENNAAIMETCAFMTSVFSLKNRPVE